VADGAVQPNFGGAFEVDDGAELPDSGGGLPPGRRSEWLPLQSWTERGCLRGRRGGIEAGALMRAPPPACPKREVIGASRIHVYPTCFVEFPGAEPGQYRSAKRPIRDFTCIVFGPG
jgi:hypothetical protein